MASYNYWWPFDLRKAKSGMLIGVPNTDDFTPTEPDDDDPTPETVVPEAEPAVGEDDPAPEVDPSEGEGEGGDDTPQPIWAGDDLTYCGVMQNDGSSTYRVSLNGHDVRFDANGVIMECPTLTDLVRKQLYVVDVYIEPTKDTRADDGKSIDELESRDTFAIAALQAMIGSTPRADMMSDGAMTSVCRAAYRWAQAMLNVAASYRTATTPEEEETTTEGGEEQT